MPHALGTPCYSPPSCRTPLRLPLRPPLLRDTLSPRLPRRVRGVRAPLVPPRPTVPALVAAPQSFGTLLNFHPHLRALVSSGVFDPAGVFHPIPPEEATERLRALEGPFRDAVLDAFLARGTIDHDRADLLRSFEHTGFSVHAERSIPAGCDHQLTQLLEYFSRPAISQRRLTALAQLVPHIQQRYECRIHTYGAFSTTIRRRFGWIGARPVIVEAAPVAPPGTAAATLPSSSALPSPQKTETVESTASDQESDPSDCDGESGSDSEAFSKRKRRRWAELIRRVWLDDPELCERCGARMRIASVCVSPRDDEAIRAELDQRGEWNPPWLRPRAPPIGGADSPKATESASILPLTGSDARHLVDEWDDPWISNPWSSDPDSESE